MRELLEFDDAGADDDEPVKGITAGDIRAWHDQTLKAVSISDALLISWAECRKLLTEERLACAQLREDYARLDAKFETHLRRSLMANPAMKKTAD